MSYLALARKWRPRTFLQLVGQDHINKALINSLNQQRLHHAYLFTGTRGVGKTSIARLIAKALNCEKGVSADPCLKCESCIAVEQGRFLDLIEIDAASKTRVEDTRELLENVQYAPTIGRYKIYLIDEVHMLSQHSFNALLKTLEEPPEHVKFLLATTDPQKLPITVLSRCLHFNLRHLSPETIVTQLKVIMEAENYSYEEDALCLLAKAAQGSMRDALSLLDQALACSTSTLTAEEVKNILGYTQQDYALQILQALTKLDASQLIQISRQISKEGGHFSFVLDELLSYLHDITLIQHLPANNPLNDYSSELIELAKQLNPEDIQLFYQIGIKSTEEIHLAPTLAIGFEMAILRMCTFKPVDTLPIPALAHELSHKDKQAIPSHAMNNQVPEEDNRLDTILKEDIPFTTKSIEAPKTVMPSDPIKPAETSIKAVSSELNEDWSTILQKIQLTGLAQTATENAEMIGKSAGEVRLRVDKGHRSLFTPNIIQRIEQALSTYYQQTIKLSFDFSEVQASPALQKSAAYTQSLQEAELSLEQDPFLKSLKQEFSAELVKNSIEPR
ncbi:DNA polymerase III, gamma and tau subunits [Legionella busanensis]|uniref:DNA polymerase III subunit gamma/tau n=1 Tax=Legionella busanensis TaxID=190655 RepID=A0A378JGE9_9GAMM|nr:DNA polymerase III subunit gamma/tau [Legionella busanensis]STX50356.1 DNA polymerase III, gamma and tau subunits [Legionella busanensis]